MKFYAKIEMNYCNFHEIDIEMLNFFNRSCILCKSASLNCLIYEIICKNPK